MTKEELIKKLLTFSGDHEMDHINADDALLVYINDPDITKAFNEMEKWYA